MDSFPAWLDRLKGALFGKARRAGDVAKRETDETEKGATIDGTTGYYQSRIEIVTALRGLLDPGELFSTGHYLCQTRGLSSYLPEMADRGFGVLDNRVVVVMNCHDYQIKDARVPNWDDLFEERVVGPAKEFVSSDYRVGLRDPNRGLEVEVVQDGVDESGCIPFLSLGEGQYALIAVPNRHDDDHEPRFVVTELKSGRSAELGAGQVLHVGSSTMDNITVDAPGSALLQIREAAGQELPKVNLDEPMTTKLRLVRVRRRGSPSVTYHVVSRASSARVLSVEIKPAVVEVSAQIDGSFRGRKVPMKDVREVFDLPVAREFELGLLGQAIPAEEVLGDRNFVVPLRLDGSLENSGSPVFAKIHACKEGVFIVALRHGVHVQGRSLDLGRMRELGRLSYRLSCQDAEYVLRRYPRRVGFPVQAVLGMSRPRPIAAVTGERIMFGGSGAVSDYVLPPMAAEGADVIGEVPDKAFRLVFWERVFLHTDFEGSVVWIVARSKDRVEKVSQTGHPGGVVLHDGDHVIVDRGGWVVRVGASTPQAAEPLATPPVRRRRRIVPVTPDDATLVDPRPAKGKPRPTRRKLPWVARGRLADVRAFDLSRNSITR